MIEVLFTMIDMLRPPVLKEIILEVNFIYLEYNIFVTVALSTSKGQG